MFHKKRSFLALTILLCGFLWQCNSKQRGENHNDGLHHDEFTDSLIVDTQFQKGTFTNTTLNAEAVTLADLGGSYVSTGTFISRALDLGMVATSAFIGYNIVADLDDSYILSVAFSNSDDVNSLQANDFIPVTSREQNIFSSSGGGRYLFYKVVFSTSDDAVTPELKVFSVQPNNPNLSVVQASGKTVPIAEKGFTVVQQQKAAANKEKYTPTRSIPYPKPAIRTRADWGAKAPKCQGNDSIREVITVHHTAGYQSNYYNNGGDKHMRIIQSFHQDDRGWCDIGYHFLIGPDGIIYEGREANVMGSHTRAHNSRNIGVALVGYFTNPVNDELQGAQKESLEKLLAWLSYTFEIDPEANRNSDGYYNIRVHKDWADVYNDGYNIKDCAGKNIYPMMASIRSTVAQRILIDGLPTSKDVLLNGADVIQSDHPYTNDTTQEWYIDARSESSYNAIEINFASFDVEANYDFVKIYDGHTNQFLEQFTGALGTFKTTSYQTNYLRVEFTSDYSVTANGFEIDGYTLTFEQPEPELTYTAHFESAHPYSNNQIQEYLVNQVGAKWYKLYFDQFSLENGYDYVKVYTGDGATLLKTFTGVIGAFYSKKIFSENGLKIVFTSDYSVTSSGFKLSEYKVGGDIDTTPATASNPSQILSLPAVITGDTSDNNVGQDIWNNYGCASSIDESGRENVYSFVAPASGTITATISDPVGVDIDIQALSSLDPANACLGRHDKTITFTVLAGQTYYLSADTYNSQYGDRHGSYTLNVSFE